MKRKEAAAILREAGIEDAAHDVLALFRAFGYADARVYAEDPDVSDPAFAEALKRRAAHVPLAYILGQADFYRETYEIDEHCLIPRSDTEVLVDTAVSRLKSGARFADLCTGSGCIAVSVLLHTENTTAYAADISRGALAIARRNAGKYGVTDRVTFSEEDVLTASPNGKFDAVLSNPPYVRNGVYDTLSPEVKSEPVAAFLGGEDGMDFYRAILRQYKNALEPDGFFAFEIGYDQKEDIERLADENGYEAEVKNDLGGHPRVAVLKKAR